jgi:hypothetical protein
MNKIKVDLIYPPDFKLDTKELNLTEIEVNSLLNCTKVGSEGKYFIVQEKIFEDTPSGTCVTVILE